MRPGDVQNISHPGGAPETKLYFLLASSNNIFLSRFGSSEDGSTDGGDSNSDFSDIGSVGGGGGGGPKYSMASSSANRVKRASRMKARRNSVHEIKIV